MRFFDLPEKARFLIVGGVNTLFSLLLFSALVWAASDYLHYQVILVITHVVCVTTSFVGMKWLVFRARGRVVYEYLRLHLVYLVVLAVNALCLYVFVEFLSIPVIPSQFIATAVIVIVSYVGSKYFAFGLGPRASGPRE
jgi:putative flippase GtrA